MGKRGKGWIFLLAIGFFVAGTACQLRAGNVIKNGDFEEVDASTKIPTSWKTWVASGQPVFSVDDTVKHSGKYSLKIVGPSTDARGVLTQEIYPAPGEYELSVWVKTENLVPKGGDYSEGVVISYTLGGKRQTIERRDLVGTHDWTEIKKTITLPAGLDFGPWIWCTSGTIWWDDMRLTPKGDTGGSAAVPTETKTQVLENFDDCGKVTVKPEPDNPAAIAFSGKSSEQVKEGSASLKVSAQYPGAWSCYVISWPSPLAIPAGASRIGMWLYGDPGSNGKIEIHLKNSSGQGTKEVLTAETNFSGWRYVSVSIAGKNITEFGQMNVYSRQAASATFYFDSLKVE